MKNYIIHKLRKDTWKGTLLPIEYTSKEYYDVDMQRTDDGFQISIQKKKFVKPFIHRLEDCEYQDKTLRRLVGRCGSLWYYRR